MRRLPLALALLLATPTGAATLALGPAAAPASAEEPASPTVLISEVANGGGGASSNASRVSADDFIELTNYGAEPADISGWRILRCGQTGDGYGPQKVVPAGTVLAPGDQYTVGSPTSTNKAVVKRDADYDETGSTLHEFGFGAWLETPTYDVVDRVGFYHPSVYSDCGQDDRALARPLDHRLNQSHQRVAATGDVEADWIVGTRTPDAANTSEPRPGRLASAVRFTEIANGDRRSDSNQFVEITNTGAEPVDITGWKLYRCGENGTTYLQHGSLPNGLLQPGESYLAANAAAQLGAGVTPDATYATNMHWRDFGALLTRPDDRIVDGAGFYANRNSMCTAGSPQAADADQLQDESYHRISDTDDDSADFLLARERTPGVVSARDDLTAPAEFARGPLRISELVAAGPAGASDEFVEIGNYGDQPVDLSGYSLTRCEGTGQGNAGTQVADLGPRVLQPGEVWLGTAVGAPAALREAADATWTTGLNEASGYGAYLRAPDGSVADAVAVYETTTFSPCLQFGSELRNYTRNDLGESYQRARTTGDNEEDFMLTPARTPGELADVAWVDPTEPQPGELDPVELAQVRVPGTPATEVTPAPEGEQGAQVRVTTTDADGGDLDVALRAAAPADVDVDAVRMWAGSTARPVPRHLEVVGERRVATAPALTTRSAGAAYPFQRFELPVTEVPAGGLDFTWTGTTGARNDVQMYAWDAAEGTSGAWTLLTAGTPSADGDLSLVGTLEADVVVDDLAHVLVIDGPRVEGGAVEEIGVTDRAFLEPQQYDWAFNHMTDTQFLSEGFRDVFRQMATWVAANAEARKIGYSTNTGDLIENWIAGNSDPVRARKEFRAARDITDLITDAGVPNGVLPGNHDNFWGRSNDLYNEYFGPEAFRDQPWWGAAWRPGDNSAHYDFVEQGGVPFLMLSLPYRPTQEQIDWGREVAAAYPDHNVVLLTHSYLDTEKNIENRDNRYTARGEDLWADLVAPSDNVFLVLGGHYHGVAAKYGDPVTGEQVDAVEIANDAVAVRNTGATGRTVLQMLADYQGYRSTQPQPRADTLDRDTGFQRLLQLDMDAELMAVNTYSPALDSFDAHTYDEAPYRGDQARYTATDDEFVAKIDLLVDRSVETAAWSVTGASSEVDAATGAAGETVGLSAPDVRAGDVLHAVVTDDTGQTVRSAPVVLGVDDVPALATSTTLEASRTGQVNGAPDAARAELTATVSAEDAAPAGEVEFVRDGGRVVGTADLDDAGEASLLLPVAMEAGERTFRARFVPAAGSGLAASTSQEVAVRVRKAGSTTTARLVRNPVGPRQQGAVAVTVGAPGLTPSGRVRVVVKGGGAGKQVVLGRLAGGRVTVTLPRRPRGDHAVRVRYLASAQVKASRAPELRLRVR